MMQEAKGGEASSQQGSATESQAVSETKELPQENSALLPHEAHGSDNYPNPLYILAPITLGIPALALIFLVAINPGMQAGTFSTLMLVLVLSAFVIAAIFEIKRLADQPSDKDSH